jgi:hypothetical protein
VAESEEGWRLASLGKKSELLEFVIALAVPAINNGEIRAKLNSCLFISSRVEFYGCGRSARVQPTAKGNSEKTKCPQGEGTLWTARKG